MNPGVILGAVYKAVVDSGLLVSTAELAGYSEKCNVAYMNFRRAMMSQDRRIRLVVSATTCYKGYVLVGTGRSKNADKKKVAAAGLEI